MSRSALDLQYNITRYFNILFLQDLDFPDKTDITFMVDMLMEVIGDLSKDPLNYRNRQFTSVYTGIKGSDDDLCDP